jgi:hypothetical protein
MVAATWIERFYPHLGMHVHDVEGPVRPVWSYGQCGDRAARRRKMLLSRRCIGRGQLSSALLADATITELLQSNGNPLTPYVLNIQHMQHVAPPHK